MPIGHVDDTEDRGFLRRWGLPLTLTAVTVVAVVLAWLAALGPQVVVYPTTDFARLPVSAMAPANPASPTSCASVRPVNGSPKLVDEACGSPASTFRVISRVADVSQCVRDADITYSAATGAACLDYDWTAGQCLEITKNIVKKEDCTRHGAILPQMAIIGAVDVTYCSEGGIAHSVRHFTVCTIAGEKNCKGRKTGTAG